MDGYIDVQSMRLATPMSKQEFNSLLLGFGDRRFDRNSFDHVRALWEAKLFMSETDFIEARNCLDNGGNTFVILFQKVFTKLPFYKTIHILQQLKQHMLIRIILDRLYRTTPYQLGRTEVPFTRHINEYFFQWKHSADANIDNIYYMIVFRVNGMNMVIAHNAYDRRRLQWYIHQKTVLCVLWYQMCSSRQSKENVLRELRRVIPTDVDRRSLDIVYHGKMAVTEANDNNSDAVEEHLRIGWVITEQCLPCFAVFSMVHDILYSYRYLFVNRQSREYLDKVIEWGHRAMYVVQDQETDDRVLWSRLFLQYMFLSLLRINGVLGIERNCVVDAADLKLAKTALEQYEQLLAGIPVRRRMIYTLARARYHELVDETEVARMYANDAVRLAEEGTYFVDEKRNIRLYRDMLVGERGEREILLYSRLGGE